MKTFVVSATRALGVNWCARNKLDPRSPNVHLVCTPQDLHEQSIGPSDRVVMVGVIDNPLAASVEAARVRGGFVPILAEVKERSYY